MKGEGSFALKKTRSSLASDGSSSSSGSSDISGRAGLNPYDFRFDNAFHRIERYERRMLRRKGNQQSP